MSVCLLELYYRGYNILLANKNLTSIKSDFLKRFLEIIIIPLCYSLSTSL